MTMNNDTTNNDHDKHADDAMSTLMNLAGPRADIPAALERRVHDNVLEHWQSATRKKNMTRWMVPASLAAMIVLAISFGMRSSDVLPQVVGTVAFAVGSSDQAGMPLAIGDPVRAGDNLETGHESGISIALSGDVSLRIASNSSVRLDGPDDIALLYGQIYADSGERIYRDRHLTISTPDGSARDIGTQFSVGYENTQMSVAVREGRVDVLHDQSVFSAEAGDKLVLRPGADVETDRVLPSDPSWDWAAALAPEFDTRNRSLMDFLKWAARETGKTLQFSSDEVRMAAMRTKVVGSIKDVGPDEAIEAVLSTTQFDYDVDDQSITIKQ